ncbi:hypothetical protein ATANTOWER_025055 [Ataeniobius toweri]|uniref:Uncharacterized protein n=1 Tax=Ataeniobius toweri TaxID=208326 RepID=A0ABU7BM93_9TELE|nr:hypothetical protein [Ataeniobius toweri]
MPQGCLKMSSSAQTSLIKLRPRQADGILRSCVLSFSLWWCLNCVRGSTDMPCSVTAVFRSAPEPLQRFPQHSHVKLCNSTSTGSILIELRPRQAGGICGSCVYYFFLIFV